MEELTEKVLREELRKSKGLHFLDYPNSLQLGLILDWNIVKPSPNKLLEEYGYEKLYAIWKATWNKRFLEEMDEYMQAEKMINWMRCTSRKGINNYLDVKSGVSAQ